MALDVQWLHTGDSCSHCLIGALRNGYLWAGDADSACMAAVETPLSALSCVTAWQNDGGSYAAAAGQGSSVLIYTISCKDVQRPSQGRDTSAPAASAAKKKKKKARIFVCFASRFAHSRFLRKHQCARLLAQHLHRSACSTSAQTSRRCGTCAESGRQVCESASIFVQAA
jgi:hypothetical protein